MNVRSTRRTGSAINVQPVSLLSSGRNEADKTSSQAFSDPIIHTRKTEGILSTGGLIGDFDAIFAAKPVASNVVCLESGSALVIDGAKWKQFCGRFPGGLLFFMEQHFVEVGGNKK